VSFFGIGPMEMVVIAVVALMVFNPRELPKMLRSVAKFWGQLRATADEFKDTIMNADGVDEIQELVKGTKGQIQQVENDARRELMKARAEMRKAQQKLIKANQAKLQQKQVEIDAQKEAGAADAETPDAEPDSDLPVAATAPHDRKAAAAAKASAATASSEAPEAPAASSDGEQHAEDEGKDGHNQGAA